VALDLDRLDHGKHIVRSGWGSVDVTIPRDAEVRLEVKVDGGSARVDYRSRPEAAAVLHASTDSGSLRIRQGLARGDARPSRPHASDVPRPAGHSHDAGDRAPRPLDYDAELARILMLVAVGELTTRDANELLEALKQGR
jgi:hypothetical protein